MQAGIRQFESVPFQMSNTATVLMPMPNLSYAGTQIFTLERVACQRYCGASRMTNGRRQDFFVKIGNSSGQSKGPIKQYKLVDKCRHHLNVLPPKIRLTESEKHHVEVIKRLSQPVCDSSSQSKKAPRASGPKVLSDLRSVNTRDGYVSLI